MILNLTISNKLSWIDAAYPFDFDIVEALEFTSFPVIPIIVVTYLCWPYVLL